jgi:hypothetical protein
MSDTRSKPTQHEIAVCAYCIWEKEGRPQGRALNHWLQAELQLVVATIWDEGMTEQEEKITAELVCIYVKEQALSEAVPSQNPRKTRRSLRLRGRGTARAVYRKPKEESQPQL